MMLRDDDETDLIDLPPIPVTPAMWARHSAYRIDALMGNRVVIVQSWPSRINGELEAGDLWKARHRALWRAIEDR